MMQHNLLETLNESQRDNLRAIKKGFRQSMNADLSNSMRNHGLNYSLNFGVPAPRIKLIASDIEQDAKLAEYLWSENVRESKIIATYLYPVSQMTFDIACEWISQIKYTEIADQICKNLLIGLPFAKELMIRFITSDNNLERYTGTRLLSQIIMSGKTEGIDFQIVFDEIRKNVISGITYLTSSAVNIADAIYDSQGELMNMAKSFFAAYKDDTNIQLQNFYFLFEEDNE